MVATLYPRQHAEIQKTLKAMKKAGKKITKSKKTARAFLLKNGFITKDNKIGERYR